MINASSGCWRQQLVPRKIVMTMLGRGYSVGDAASVAATASAAHQLSPVRDLYDRESLDR
jgi:hypothetical protein